MGQLIGEYIRGRSCLRLVVLLVDGRLPAQSTDARLVQELAASGTPFAVVATKLDLLSASQQTSLAVPAAGLAGDLGLGLGLLGGSMLGTSSRTGLGRRELWRIVLAGTLGEPNRFIVSGDSG